jgi:choline-sulfatase
MNRSRRLIVYCVLVAAAFLPASIRAADAPRRPNVLWICADDHAAYVCGAYGNRLVQTPNIDALAAGGMRFERAFCNSPVCTASRQSFLTGRYPRTIGVTQLATALPESETTLAELLRDAGYDTVAIGKMHFNSDLKHGFDSHVDLPDHQKWLHDKGREPIPAGIETQPAWKPFRDPARIWLNSAVLPFSAVDADMPGTYFANRAAQFLTDRSAARGRQAQDEKPFFLMVSFYEPHSPFHFPINFRERHRSGDFEVPAVGPEDDWQVPAIFRDLTRLEKQGIAAAYYSATEFLDKNVGLVLEALEESGLDQETLVVYTGDHGYLLGQHGRFEKHCCYEPAIRAPLVMRYPGKTKLASSTTVLVEFIDIAPTILDYCGIGLPQAVQGRSLVPLLAGQTDRHRQEVFIEYSENEEAAVRTEKWKLIYTTGKRERQDGYATGLPLPGRTIRLFDLENDPEEMTNVARRPEHAPLLAELKRALADHLRRTARRPEHILRSDDMDAVIDFALAPRDVGVRSQIPSASH